MVREDPDGMRSVRPRYTAAGSSPHRFAVAPSDTYLTYLDNPAERW